MQKSTRDALIMLPIAFIGMMYILFQIIAFDQHATITQWIAGLGGIFVALLFMFQMVKGLMKDLSDTP